jgi:hypothetical protein
MNDGDDFQRAEFCMAAPASGLCLFKGISVEIWETRFEPQYYFAMVKFPVTLAQVRCQEFWQTGLVLATNVRPHSHMKYALLALAAVLTVASCKTSQPAPAAPPMVDMGVRSGK